METRLYFDCFSGVSGDMILGALVDAGLPIKALTHGLKGLGLNGYRLEAKKVRRGGILATKVNVVIKDGFRSPLSLHRIRRIISSSRLPSSVRDMGQAVFDRLAWAEGIAHRVPARNVQFHEVGVVDSLVDVMGCLVGCHLLGIQQVAASPVNVGSGWLQSSHGHLPVPGPAVALLAKGVPVYTAGPNRELTTPTGMALLRILVGYFGPLPMIRPESVGYGAGSADPEGWPNALRVFIGKGDAAGRGAEEVITQIETNLDDLHPQAYETVIERLFAGGALDVTLSPVIMKRGRPGIVLTALTPPEKAETVAQIILKDTTALGVRMQQVERRVLPRRIETVRLAGAAVRVKVARVEEGFEKVAPEYRDCKRIADEMDRPVQDVMNEALLAFKTQRQRPRRKK